MANYKKPDYWQIKARKEGYPARSIYKLKEMDEKFGLLCPAGSAQPFKVLDLGAAPGSWSLFVMRKMQKKVSLVAADLSALSREFDGGLFSADNFYFIQGDISDPSVRDSILSRGPYSLIISDAAPATTGSRFIDTCRSLELAEVVASYAESALIGGGNFAVKVFQGGDTSELLKRLKALFKTAKSCKPEACRSESFETYYLGLGKRQPLDN